MVEATLALVAECGLEKFRIAEVAARSGVHETSIYRRWGSRNSLLLDALLHHSQATLEVPDSGSLRTDLLRLGHAFADYLTDPLGAALVRTFEAGEVDQAIGDRMSLWNSRVEAMSQILNRATARGEWIPDQDPRLLFELLFGSLYFRIVVLRDWSDTTFVDRMVETLLARDA